MITIYQSTMERDHLKSADLIGSIETSCCYKPCPNAATIVLRVHYNKGMQHEKDDYLQMCDWHHKNMNQVLVKL